MADLPSSMLILLFVLYPPFHQLLFTGGAIADGSNAIPTPTVPSVSEPMWNPSLYAEASRSILEERHGMYNFCIV